MTSPKDDENTEGPTNNLATSSGAYVLNALDETERIEFEAQLDGSEELRNEVTELTDTAVLLGLAVEPVQPSANLKASIMAQLASTPQLPREARPVRTLQAAPALADDAPAEEITQTTFESAATRKSETRWFNRPIVALTAVAAAIALIAGVGITVNGLVASSSQNQAQSQVTTIVQASDSKQAIADVTGGGTAKLVWSEELGQSAVYVDGLASLPSDKAYELWYIDAEGNPTAAGLIDGDASTTWKVLEGKMSAGDTVGVTVEPASGSDAPTTTPIVAIASA